MISPSYLSDTAKKSPPTENIGSSCIEYGFLHAGLDFVILCLIISYLTSDL